MVWMTISLGPNFIPAPGERPQTKLQDMLSPKRNSNKKYKHYTLFKNKLGEK